MKYRFLGNTGIQVSEISLGSWLTFGNVIDNKTAEECFKEAFENGINFFDTADVYNNGGAESVWGDIIGDYSRSDLVLATKCFFPMGKNVNSQGLSRKHIAESIHASLKRLKTDYVDLYQCHRYDSNTPLEETISAMNTLIQQGKILYWGVSQWSAVQIIEAIYLSKQMGCQPPVSDQPIYNIINRSLEVDVLDVCERYNVGIVVYSPMAQGILTGKYSGGKVPVQSRAANSETSIYMKKRMTTETFEKVDMLKPIAKEIGLDLPQFALAWCLRQNQLSSVITGASNPSQISENVKASGVIITDEISKQVDLIFENYPVDQYTGSRTRK